MNINWDILDVNRNINDGFVNTVHYSITATDGNFSANTYGSINYKKENETFIPYESLTKDIVVEWVKTYLDMNEIEQHLSLEIEKQKTPTQANGLPW